MSTVQGADPETYGVSKIAGRKVTLAQPAQQVPNALDGQKLLQYALTGAAAALVRMEEAGDDNTLSQVQTTTIQKTHINIWGVNVPLLGKNMSKNLNVNSGNYTIRVAAETLLHLIQVLRVLLHFTGNLTVQGTTTVDLLQI